MLERANLFLPSLAAAALFFSAAIDALSCGFFVSAARCAANTASSSPKVIAESVALQGGVVTVQMRAMTESRREACVFRK